MDTLKELYVDELKDLYSAENQILKALPQMIRKASDKELKKAFTTHEKQTRQQVKRLERIFQQLGETPGGKKCKGMEGVIADGKELMQEKADADVMDAGLISAAQHVEHYEIAGYGTVRTYATELGLDKHADLLAQTLEEEEQTDQHLTQLAEGRINIEALADGDATAGNGSSARSSRGSARGTSRGASRGSSAGRGSSRSGSRSGTRARSGR